MSVNRKRPHVLVLPEDDANRQLANGFHLDLGQHISARQFQVLVEAGGWMKVLKEFLETHVAAMERNPYRHMILLIDLDNREQRLRCAKDQVPGHLTDRVFILSSLSKPEALRADLGPYYEAVGLAMARDCWEETNTIWGHPLRHNSSELDRLRITVRPILFP